MGSGNDRRALWEAESADALLAVCAGCRGYTLLEDSWTSAEPGLVQRSFELRVNVSVGCGKNRFLLVDMV